MTFWVKHLITPFKATSKQDANPCPIILENPSKFKFNYEKRQILQTKETRIKKKYTTAFLESRKDNFKLLIVKIKLLAKIYISTIAFMILQVPC